MKTLTNLLFKNRQTASSASKAVAPKPDTYIISFPKSGRTWLSHLYCNYFYFLYESGSYTTEGTPEESLTGISRQIYRPEESERFLQLIEKNKGKVPLPAFQHATRGRKTIPYYHFQLDAERFLDRPVIFMTRDPRDVVVSYFHHVTVKDKFLPPDVTLSEFLRSDVFGIRYIITYMNAWVPYISNHSNNLAYISYEEMRANPAEVFSKILRFLQLEADARAIDFAVEASSFDRMKQEELRIRQGVIDSENALRMRKGKIGGYQEELDASDIEYLERIIQEHLDPFFVSYRKS